MITPNPEFCQTHLHLPLNRRWDHVILMKVFIIFSMAKGLKLPGWVNECKKQVLLPFVKRAVNLHILSNI